MKTLVQILRSALILALITACQSPIQQISTAEADANAVVATVTEADRAITEPSIAEFKIFFKAAEGVQPQAYAWYSSGSQTIQPNGTWAATTNMTDIGNNWFMSDLLAKGVPMGTNVGIIIKTNTGTKLSGTNDQFRTATGWLKMSGTTPVWTTTNPEASPAGKPIITLTPQDGTITGVKTFTALVNDNGFPLISKAYSVGDNSYILNGDTFNVDAGSLAPGASVSIMVKAVNLAGSTVIGPFVYTKPQNTQSVRIHFKTTSTTPKIWLWEGTGAGGTGNRPISQLAGLAWPGASMTAVAGAAGWYYWDVPSTYNPLSPLNMHFNGDNTKVIALNPAATGWYYTDSKWYATNPEAQPSVSVSPAGGYFSTSVTVTLKAQNPANAFYQLGATGDVTAYNDGQTITFGSTLANGESIDLTVTSDDNKLKQIYTFTKNTTFNGVRVYVKGYSKVYYWAVDPPTAVAATTWPGVNLVTDTNGWKKFDFTNATSTNLIFNTTDGTVAGLPAQTPDLSRTTGTWYYKGGTWYSSDPDNIAPVITAEPPTGTKSSTTLAVALNSTTPSDKIYYTTNGSTPTTASTLYSTPLSLTTTTTVKALGVNVQGTQGAVATFSYTVDPNLDLTAPSISANPVAGTYTTAQLVRFTITDNKAGITAYYTTDGSQPTTATTTKFSTTGTTGTSADFNVSARTTFNFLVRDTAGNEYRTSYYYNIGATSVREDFREETIYFLITTRFNDGDSTNNVWAWDDAQAGNVANNDPAWRGDFKGLIQKLDYIKALGFTAIWVTPVVKNASGYDYHGYHAINHKEVDPRYLSSDTTYQTLIDAVHAKGMKLIQDIVLNHTGNFGEENLYPMFKKDPTKPDTAANLMNIAPAGLLPSNYSTLTPAAQYGARINAMKEDAKDTAFIYHHEKSLSWEGYTVQTGQIAGDCVDLNTENPVVSQYLRDAYFKYIDMGVDAFRIDTVKHISRLTFNKEFIPQFKARGGDKFYIFGEICTRYRQVWNNGIPAISAPFYTWKESKTYAWGDRVTNENSVFQNWQDYTSNTAEFNSANHSLNGNAYRTVDYTKRSGFDVIDFPMHWNFANARDAFGVAVGNDYTYNDATWNVTYVDSHDYAPDTAPENQRFALGQNVWAENLSLIFTFRGVPTLFYGSEIEFQKGKMIDVGPNDKLANTGRAYYGDKISGSVTATNFGKFTGASGNVATTLAHPLAQHIRQLNLIRHAVPALQKGQYSTSGISGGGMAYKRRFTNASTDSFALVTVSGDATFTGIPNGTYVDAVTGDTKNITGGTLSTSGASGQGNLRVYVLSTGLTPAPGKIVDTAGLTYIH